MVALSLIPGGGVAAGGIRAGVRAGSKESKTIAARAVGYGEAIKFGCKSIEEMKDGDELSSGGDVGEEDSNSLMDSLLGDGQKENPYEQDAQQISDAWDLLSGLL